MKKLVSIIIVIVIAVLLYFAYNNLLSPEGIIADKEVTIQVNIKNIDESYSFQTEYEFLYELVKENKKELGAGFKEYSYGVMIIELLNYRVNESNNEYFHIYVNGEDAIEGVQQIVLNDGDVYTFELKAW